MKGNLKRLPLIGIMIQNKQSKRKIIKIQRTERKNPQFQLQIGCIFHLETMPNNETSNYISVHMKTYMRMCLSVKFNFLISVQFCFEYKHFWVQVKSFSAVFSESIRLLLYVMQIDFVVHLFAFRTPEIKRNPFRCINKI